MTDQQATALVELAACPEHRRENYRPVEDKQLPYRVCVGEWDMSGTWAVAHNFRLIDHYATRELAQAYVDYMNQRNHEETI